MRSHLQQMSHEPPWFSRRFMKFVLAVCVADTMNLQRTENPETVQCEITGMKTLLHAPIQTPLQEIECHDINSGQELNKMNRTLLFSEENEMDMTAGHTVMIMHDIGIYEETNKAKKIDSKSFLAELKLNKKNSEMNENNFISGPIKGNETCLPQQKTNVGNSQKIKFDDFLKSLKSTEPFPTPATEVSFLPSEVPERTLCSSEVNAYFHLQGKSNITNVFGGLDIKTAVTQYCLSNETIAPPTCYASEQTGHGMVTLHCGDESMDMTVACTERVLPAGLSSLTAAKQHQNFESDYSVSNDSYRSKPSSHPPGIQQHPAMCIVNNGEAGVSEKHGVKLISRDGSLPSNQGISVTKGFFESMSLLDGNKSTVSSSICSDMEVTRNCTGFICDADSKQISKLARRTCEKQSKTVSRLMERTVFEDGNMDTTENQASTNANMNGIPHSIPYNEMASSKQEAVYVNKELQNLSIKPFSWPSSHLERKEDTLLVSLPSDKLAVFSGKGIDLSRNHVANSEAKQGECQFLLSDDKATFAELSGKTDVNYKTNRKSGCSNSRVPLVPADKTVTFTSGEDMELIKPTTSLIDKSLKTSGFYKKPQEETRPGNHKIIGPATDKTVVFSLENNEMEITKSCTVAVNYNFMQHCERDPPVFPLQPVDKTVVYASHNDMDMTTPNTYIVDQPLRNPGAQAVHKLDYKVDRRPPIGSTRDKTVEFSLTEDNEMEITRSHTVTVNHDAIQQIGGAPQAPSPFPAEKSCVFVHNSSIAVSKSTSFIPADKALMLSHHNIEITKPTEHVTDLSQKNKEKETEKVILPGFVKEESVKFYLHEDNEMEITKSLTVAANHDIQHMEGASQELFLIPAEKTKMSGHNSNMATSVVPADKNLMWMHSNDMEITGPLIDTSLKNTNSKALPQKETNKAMLSGRVKGNAITVKLHDSEMEITKCHTVEGNHDTFSQHERRPPVQFYQDSIDITGSHDNVKNMPANIRKLGNETKWEVSSNQTLALATVDNMESAERNTMLMNNRTVQHHPSVSKAGLLIPLNKNSVFTCYQDGKEINKWLPNATADQSLEEKHALNKNTKQESGNMSFFTSHGITQDIDITTNHTVNIYGPNCYVRNPEKQVLHSVAKSREKTIAFSDGEAMEMTRNHTIGIEFMNTNNCNNELSSCSQTESGSEFSSLAVPNEKALDIAKTDKHMPEKSISSSNMELSVNKVNTQNLLRIQNNQLESHASRINNLAAVTANYALCCEENECMLPVEMLVQNPEFCRETTLNLNAEGMCMLLTESETSKDYPGKIFLSRHEGNPIGVIGGLPAVDTATNIDLGRVTKDWQTNLDLSINNFCSEEDPVLLSKLPSILNDCSKLEKKPEFGLISKNGRLGLGEELMKPKDPLALTESIGIESSKSFTEGDPFRVPFNAMQKDNCQMKKLPLGIFPPKLPNKRKPTISSVEDTGGRTKLQDSEDSLLVKKSSDKIMQHLSPSHYISEELLPPCVEEMDSSELLNSELQEKVCDMMDEKETTGNEGCLKETNWQKRVRNQEREELQKEKKFKVDEGWNDTTELKQASLVQDEGDVLVQRNNKIEAELLMDSICEQNLQEYTVNASPTPEDLILSEYVYRPKLQIYNEDCQALSKIIEELKLCADNKDKLLVNVHKSLWEVMRTCSDEELKQFGAELNKMKSCFAKKSKILAHRGKAKLYMKLVQNVQLPTAGTVRLLFPPLALGCDHGSAGLTARYGGRGTGAPSGDSRTAGPGSRSAPEEAWGWEAAAEDRLLGRPMAMVISALAQMAATEGAQARVEDEVLGCLAPVAARLQGQSEALALAAATGDEALGHPATAAMAEALAQAAAAAPEEVQGREAAV
ncbi:UNVERIFIED_CONTAM: hypothetical protein K2H54_048442 [Gekko kuhli]